MLVMKAMMQYQIPELARNCSLPEGLFILKLKSALVVTFFNRFP